MIYEWNDDKRSSNIEKHGVDFAEAAGFDWTTAIAVEDTRMNYGEKRFRALGRIGGRLHAMVFTMRGEAVRVISLRKANDREEKLYEAHQR